MQTDLSPWQINVAGGIPIPALPQEKFEADRQISIKLAVRF